MADRRYSIGRPQQDVRLRNWPAGKVAQMKQAISILEEQLNTAMATQIEQGAKRIVSSRVPRVTGVAIATGFKSFSITFNEARGIPDLLFYEIQKDSTSSFADPTTYTISQTSLTIPTTTERETIYVRVRVVDSKFQVGPWSSTATAVGSSNFRIDTVRGARVVQELTEDDFDTWVDITSASITVSASAVGVSIQPGVHAYIDLTPATRPPGAVEDYQADFVVKFRLLKDGVVDPDIDPFTVYTTSRVRNNDEESANQETRQDVAVFGNIITPLESLTNTTRTYTLQAYYDSVNSTYVNVTTGTTLSFPWPNGPRVIVDNFDVLEIIQST